MPKTILVPPDGGYGWVIVLASALNNFVLIPLIQSFGLIFKDTFIELGFSATQGSLIINVNSAFGMLIGLFNGPLLNNYGYRKISFLGGFLLTLGVILTSFARNFVGFLIFYGFIASLGLGLTASSYSLAINTYFKKRRNKAISLGMTITGFGPIVMPQIINFLMQNYSIPGVTLILGGICSHSFIAAMLLQPVKYHLKKVVVEDEEVKEAEEYEVAEKEEDHEETIAELPVKQPLMRSISTVENGRLRKNSLMDSNLSIVHDSEIAGIYGIDSTLGGSSASLATPYARRRPSAISITQTKTEWWKSESTVNLESSDNIFDDNPNKNHFALSRISNISEKPYNPDMSFKIEKKPLWKRFFLRVSLIFDLNLLTDPIYVNIMLGMSLAIFAELNFSVLTAFILADLELSTSEIATFMSLLGSADIVFRFLAPYIGDCFNLSSRVMYMLTLSSLIATRFGLIIVSGYKNLLIVAVVLGCAKGIRTVYMSLVIPTYVPLERLASASGIQMMVNGLFIIIGGPCIGLIRDYTGSYYWCIIIMNCVTFSTILMWSVEFLIVKFKK